MRAVRLHQLGGPENLKIDELPDPEPPQGGAVVRIEAEIEHVQIFGLTRATTRREIARAALESACTQTRDLLEAMRRRWATRCRNDPVMPAQDLVYGRMCRTGRLLALETVGNLASAPGRMSIT